LKFELYEIKFFFLKPKLRTIKAEVVVTCEYNGEEIYKYTWSNASFYCDPSESFDIKRNKSLHTSLFDFIFFYFKEIMSYKIFLNLTSRHHVIVCCLVHR
jgi:hypothetical protein